MLTVFYLDRTTSVNIVPLNSGQQRKGMLFILIADRCDNGPFVPVPAMFRAAVFTTKFTRIEDMVAPYTVWFFMVSSIYAKQTKVLCSVWENQTVPANSSTKRTKALCSVRLPVHIPRTILHSEQYS